MATSSNTKIQEIIDDLLLIFDTKKTDSEATLAPIFEDCIKIPENKEESQKFVDKPIQFDEIIEIDEKLKDIVYGYINKTKSCFDVNYIPLCIIYQKKYFIGVYCMFMIHSLT